MPNFNFDTAPRRSYQEPQTTKRELLQPPTQSANQPLDADWNKPLGTAGLSDLRSSQAPWSFAGIDKDSNSNSFAITPAKTDAALPVTRNEKRQRDGDITYGPSKKKVLREPTGRSSITSSPIRLDGDKDSSMGVIDLTSDVEDGDEETTFPERQFIPRADEDTKAPDPTRRKSPSPPRTFTRGLSPVAAHPRKPPIVHKSKPPIKPPGRKQKRSTPSPVASSHHVFRSRASLSAAQSSLSRVPTPVARSSLAGDIGAQSSKDASTAVTSNSERAPRVGPFVDDSSSEDEANLEAPSGPRDSLQRLVGRPRHDTTEREELVQAQEHSKSMRENAQQKNQRGLATPDTAVKTIPTFFRTPAPDDEDIVIPSIEFPPEDPQSDSEGEARPSLVRYQPCGSCKEKPKHNRSTLGNNVGFRPSKKQKAVDPFLPASKGSHHFTQGDAFQQMVQKRRKNNAAQHARKPASNQLFPRQNAPIIKRNQTTFAQELRQPYAQLFPRDEELEESEPEETAPIERPTGPFSLNSAPGIQAIKNLVPTQNAYPYDVKPSTAAAARFMGTKPPPKLTIKKSNASSLPITANDLRLYNWRREGLTWAAVKELYSQLPGTHYSSEDRMRARFRFVEPAIAPEEITVELCQQVIDGESGAEEELNRLVMSASKDPERALPADLNARPFQKISKTKAGDAKPVVVHSAQTTPKPATLPRSRPTQGGKTLNHEAFQAYLAHMTEQWQDGEESETDDLGRESSPIKPEDAVHWVYFLERRDFPSEEFAEIDEETIEDTEWMEYNATFDQLRLANAEAQKYVFTTPDGNEIFAADRPFKLDHRQDENGMVFMERNSDLGTTQVRVSRRMRTYQEHILPESKETWLAKRLYCVQVKTTKKAQDDLFDTGEAAVNLLNDKIFGSLELANSRAIEEWVRLTLKPSSGRLEQIDVERAAARAELERDLEDGGGGRIFGERLDDEERSVEVFVRALDLEGPRN
ncbi:hypothetical protein Q7P37_007671 [Cladosporium fusiforme]